MMDSLKEQRFLIALILVTAFVASIFIKVENEYFNAVKDVMLVIVGFYFGAKAVNNTKKE